MFAAMVHRRKEGGGGEKKVFLKIESSCRPDIKGVNCAPLVTLLSPSVINFVSLEGKNAATIKQTACRCIISLQSRHHKISNNQ